MGVDKSIDKAAQKGHKAVDFIRGQVSVIKTNPWPFAVFGGAALVLVVVILGLVL
jgi:hypothetical protein